MAINQSYLYHLGMTAVAKSTLADAINRRFLEIFEALFKEILDRTIACAPEHGFKFHNPLCVIHDRDALFNSRFDTIFESIGVKIKKLPPFTPRMNTQMENFIRAIKTECLDK